MLLRSLSNRSNHLYPVFFRQPRQEIPQKLVAAKAKIFLVLFPEQRVDLGFGCLYIGQAQYGHNIVIPQLEGDANRLQHIVVRRISHPFLTRRRRSFLPAAPARHKTIEKSPEGRAIALAKSLVFLLEKKRAKLIRRHGFPGEGEKFHELQVGNIEGISQSYQDIVVDHALNHEPLSHSCARPRFPAVLLRFGMQSDNDHAFLFDMLLRIRHPKFHIMIMCYYELNLICLTLGF